MDSRAEIERELLEILGPRLRMYMPTDEEKDPSLWVGETFRVLRSAVASGDPQAISLACELIAEDPKLPFGKLIKSDLARALKKQFGKIIAFERQQVIDTTGKLLGQEFAPRELEDYCKLVKKFPRAEVLTNFAGVTPRNAKAKHLLDYIRNDA